MAGYYFFHTHISHGNLWDICVSRECTIASIRVWFNTENGMDSWMKRRLGMGAEARAAPK